MIYPNTKLQQKSSVSYIFLADINEISSSAGRHVRGSKRNCITPLCFSSQDAKSNFANNLLTKKKKGEAGQGGVEQ